MALNIAIGGFVYDKDTNISNSDINYQAFFYQNGTASSASKWNDVRTVESSGYYSINLGDADWLGQEGSALTNAKIIIVFWKGSPLGTDRNALCNILDEWGALELTLDGSSVYTQDAQTKANINPVLQWSNNVPSHGYVNTNYNFTNTSYDVHDWSFNGVATSGTVTMNHWRTRYGQNIQLINTVDTTDYFWGDSNSNEDLSGAANSSHQWNTAGNYDIDIYVYDTCSGTTSGTENIDIYWHSPVPGITRCDSGGTPIGGNSITTPDTPVYFTYNGTDVDNTITNITWNIEDSGAYGNTDTVTSGVTSSGVVNHANGQGTSWDGHSATSGSFTNPGVHNVEITVYWYDGFSTQSITYDENFTQQRFQGPPSADINCNEAVGNSITTPDTIVTFNYTGNNPDSRITYVDWTITDIGLYGSTTTTVTGTDISDTINHTEGLGTDWYGHTQTSGAFTNPGVHNVDIDVYWNDGWDTNKIDYDENFTQQLFSGPSLSLEQDPTLAEVGAVVNFENTSTNTSRVGLGLPDNFEYDWQFNDDGNITSALDQAYSYIFIKNPNTAFCTVELCADWSNGWDTMTTCLEQDVVFKTTVTITEEDCYHNLNLVGTSDDGSLTGYSWEVYKDSTCSGTCVSGTSGSWDLIWSSPIGMDQNDKDIYFTDACCYRVYGYCHGTGSTTSDYEDIYISEACTMTSGTTSCSGIVPQTGYIQIEQGWQLISIPIEFGYWDNSAHKHVHDGTTQAKFKNYVLDQIEDIYGTGRIEVANTYTGDNQFFYSYVCGSTPDSSPHNFSLVYEDSTYKEITGFWIKSLFGGTMMLEWGE